MDAVLDSGAAQWTRGATAGGAHALGEATDDGEARSQAGASAGGSVANEDDLVEDMRESGGA